MTNPYQAYAGGNPFPLPYPPSANATFPAAGQYISLPLNLHHMYQQQWNLSYQRQFSGNWLVSVAYIGSKATHLRTSTEENPAIYIPGNSTVANTQSRRTLTLLNSTQGAYYSNITLADDGVNTNYNALRISAQHRFSHHFTLLSVYTWSHCLQDAETYGNRNSLGSTQYEDPYDRNLDHGSCDTDVRHNWNNSLVYETPKLENRVTDQLLGHWQVGGLITVHSGFPFNPLTGVDDSRTGIGLDRQNIVGRPYVQNLNTQVWINPAAFVANTIGTFGNAGYNSLLGAKFFDIDANVTRLFPITEHKSLELRFEFFNILNHVNFNNPVATLSSANFGVIQSAADPRILQLAAKFKF